MCRSHRLNAPWGLALGALLMTPLLGPQSGSQLSPPPTWVPSERSRAMTSKDVEAAIQWGMQGDPSPYLLHISIQPGGGTSSAVVGAVYTPFLRVALAARLAREKHQEFAVSDVQPDWVEPVVYVAFRWYCCIDPEHGSDHTTWNPFASPTDYVIAVPGDPVLRPMPSIRVTASPLWIRDDPSLLTSFGGDPPYPDLVLIAGYPMDVLSTSSDFVIYRRWRIATDTAEYVGMLVGRVTSDDLTRWR
jgi:hypothetical protein